MNLSVNTYLRENGGEYGMMTAFISLDTGHPCSGSAPGPTPPRQGGATPTLPGTTLAHVRRRNTFTSMQDHRVGHNRVRTSAICISENVMFLAEQSFIYNYRPSVRKHITEGTTHERGQLWCSSPLYTRTRSTQFSLLLKLSNIIQVFINTILEVTML